MSNLFSPIPEASPPLRSLDRVVTGGFFPKDRHIPMKSQSSTTMAINIHSMASFGRLSAIDCNALRPRTTPDIVKRWIIQALLLEPRRPEISAAALALVLLTPKSYRSSDIAPRSAVGDCARFGSDDDLLDSFLGVVVMRCSTLGRSRANFGGRGMYLSTNVTSHFFDSNIRRLAGHLHRGGGRGCVEFTGTGESSSCLDSPSQLGRILGICQRRRRLCRWRCPAPWIIGNHCVDATNHRVFPVGLRSRLSNVGFRWPRLLVWRQATTSES